LIIYPNLKKTRQKSKKIKKILNDRKKIISPHLPRQYFFCVFFFLAVEKWSFFWYIEWALPTKVYRA
jgi:hypothetical protein